MISYGAKAGEPDWRMLFRVSGSVFPRCICIVLPLALLAILLKVLFNRGILVEITAMTFLSNGSAWGGFSGLVNFVVVFRLSAAFSTYWNAYSTTTAMLGDWSGAAASVVAFCRNSKVDDCAVQDFLQTVVRLFSMLSACALQELSPREYAKLWGLQTLDPACIDVKSLAALDASPMRVDLCYHWIQQLLVDQQAAGILAAPAPIVGRCFAELGSGMGKFGDAKKHATTQFNFCYAQATRWMLIVYSMFMPLMMVQWSDWLVGAGIFTFLQLYFIWSLDTITGILESPFDSSNPNSIDMFVLQRCMNSALLLLLDPQTRAGPPTLEKNFVAKREVTPYQQKIQARDYENLQRRDTVHKAVLKVEGWQIQDDLAISKTNPSDAFLHDVEAGPKHMSKCASWCGCCSEKPHPSEIAVSGRYSAKRFGIIDGEKTAVLPVGIFDDKLLVAVPPWCSQQNGLNTQLRVETKSGSPSTVIIKAVAIRDRHKLYKAPEVKWKPGDYKEFSFEYKDLVSAVYKSRQTLNPITLSKVAKQAEIIVDEEIDDAKAADINKVGIGEMMKLKSHEVFCSQLVEKCGIDKESAEKEWLRRLGMAETYDHGRNARGSVTIELDIDKFMQFRQNKKEVLGDAIESLESAQSLGCIEDFETAVKQMTNKLPSFLEEEHEKANRKIIAAEKLLAKWREIDEALQDASKKEDLSQLRKNLQDADEFGLRGSAWANAEDIANRLERVEVQKELKDAMTSEDPARLLAVIARAKELGMEEDKEKAERLLLAVAPENAVSVSKINSCVTTKVDRNKLQKLKKSFEDSVPEGE